MEVREPNGIGRYRMAVLAHGSAKSLHPFVTGAGRSVARVITDAWQGYRGLEALGYVHERRSQRAVQGTIPVSCCPPSTGWHRGQARLLGIPYPLVRGDAGRTLSQPSATRLPVQ